MCPIATLSCQLIYMSRFCGSSIATLVKINTPLHSKVSMAVYPQLLYKISAYCPVPPQNCTMLFFHLVMDRYLVFMLKAGA